jgi:hypothetical protein
MCGAGPALSEAEWALARLPAAPIICVAPVRNHYIGNLENNADYQRPDSPQRHSVTEKPNKIPSSQVPTEGPRIKKRSKARYIRVNRRKSAAKNLLWFSP